MAFTQVTVTGSFKSADGLFAQGAVTFTPAATMQNGDLRIEAPVTGQLNASGVLRAVDGTALTLAATDDPGTQPSGVTYNVVELVVNQPPRIYSILVPRTAGTIDLATVAPTIPGPQSFAYDAAGAASGAVAAHAAAADPHSVYLTTAEGQAFFQAIDSDLTTIASLAPTTGNVIQSVGGAWASQTPAQVKTALALNAVTNTAQVPLSTVTQKGDLFVATASGTITRLAVGPDGQVLTADAASTPGIKWAAPTGGGGGGTVTSVTAGNSTITIAGTAAAPTIALGTVSESAITNLVADLAAKVNLSTVTTKGDLIAGTTGSAVARLAVGANTRALLADSSQATGLRWSAAGETGNELAWDGSTYQPTALAARVDIPRLFKGPTDPATVSGVVMNSAAYWDTWISSDLNGDANLLTTGEEVIPRETLTSVTVGMTSGAMRLTFFTARKSETVTQVRVLTGTTTTTTPTLVRIGIYLINTSTGAGTLVASTPNDTAIFSTTIATYTKALTASFTKTAGLRYAVGILEVATTPSQLAGQITVAGGEMAVGPRLTGTLAGQSDLPSSFTEASLSAAPNRAYTALLP